MTRFFKSAAFPILIVLLLAFVAMQVVGRDGLRLDDVWKDGPFAYQAIGVPGFPNFFMLQGPNSPVGNFSLIDVAELQLGYILRLVERVRSGACDEVDVSPSAMALRLSWISATDWSASSL